MQARNVDDDGYEIRDDRAGLAMAKNCLLLEGESDPRLTTSFLNFISSSLHSRFFECVYLSKDCWPWPLPSLTYFLPAFSSPAFSSRSCLLFDDRCCFEPLR